MISYVSAARKGIDGHLETVHKLDASDLTVDDIAEMVEKWEANGFEIVWEFKRGIK